MQEQEVAQAESTEEPDGEAVDTGIVDAVDAQAATSDGSAAEAAPEVPDDASDKIAAAQRHIDKLNMDEERAAAKKAT